MADLNNTTIGGNTAMHTGAWDNVAVGYFTTGDSSVTGVGFQPRYIEFYAGLHQTSFNSEYYSGSNSAGGDNASGASHGFATSSASSDQLVTHYAYNSNSSNGHYSYTGDGEVVYLIHTSNNGDNVAGRVRAAISSFDSDGFSLSWNATYSNVPIIYRAYK